MSRLKVLLPVDLQDRSAAFREITKAMGYVGERLVEMHFISVLPGKPVPLLGSSLPSDELLSALEVLEDELRELVSEAVPLLEEFVTKTSEGTIFKEILKYAQEIQPDMIILPSHSHSKVENILIGSVTSKVVEKAGCSVLVIR